MKEGRKRGGAFLGVLLALALALGACGRPEEIRPGAAEIASLSQAAGFLAAKVEASRGFIAGSDHRTRQTGYAYLYDNAVAAVALALAGADWHAQRIADAIVFAQEHDRKFSDGRLRNAYIEGDPRSDSGRSVAAGRVTIRLPGFWQDGRWQEDAYVVSTSTGNMAWAILALCAVSENAPEEKRADYLAAAERAADFVLALSEDAGGFTAGFEGWDEEQKKIGYKSTEHNIDVYCAFEHLARAIEAHKPEKAGILRAGAGHALDFVLSMYDEQLHCFYTGTETDGLTVSEGVIPLDANTLAILALRERLPEPEAVIAFIEARMSVEKGFDFSAGDLDGIWNEGSAQMALCYALLGQDDKYAALLVYFRSQSDKEGGIPAADRDGVSTGFVVEGSDQLWEYNNTQSIGASAWLALAQLRQNPFGAFRERAD